MKLSKEEMKTILGGSDQLQIPCNGIGCQKDSDCTDPKCPSCFLDVWNGVCENK